ncbi:MAG: hypothetical protein HYY32_04890 [Chloroflexi bacterium]|nr:hypothetical protein [Chloroflexota bacterium]
MVTELSSWLPTMYAGIAALDPPPSPTVAAYLDPGTGSLAIQMLIGAVAGTLFAAKVFWKRVAVFFKNISPGRSRNGKTGSRA